MIRIAVAFLLGHIAVLFLPELPAPSPWMWLLLPLSVVLAWLHAFGAVALVAGAALGTLAGTAGLNADMNAKWEGVEVELRGHVVSIPERKANTLQFDLELIDPSDGLPSRARIDWYEDAPSVQPGDEWQLLVRLKRRHGFANPGGFDYEGFLFRSRIGATGYVRASELNIRLSPGRGRGALLRARAHIADRIFAATSGHAMTGVLQGLAVGVQHEMSPEQWRVFSATGTTHLMAISGLHIGMVAALFAWLGARLVGWLDLQRFRIIALHGQAALGISAALGYCALAGMSVPTQRTLIMLIIYFAVRLSRRVLDVPHGLALAVVLVLLVDPFAPLAPGFWLSFLAVAAILLATAGTPRRLRMLREFGRVQFAVTLGLLPVLMSAFGTVSLVSPIANLFAVPIFTLFLVPLTLVGSAISLLSTYAAEIVFAAPLWTLELTWLALEWLAASPIAMWFSPGLPLWAYALLSAGVLILLLPGLWPMRLAGALLCMSGFMYTPSRPNVGEAVVSVLDVGQGLAIVVETHTRVLVYDTGPSFRSGRDAAEMVVLPFLRHRGIRRVDAVIVSHSDLDHAGGARTLHQEIEVDRWLSSAPLDRIPSEACRRDQRWMWDEVEFLVLHPDDDSALSENDGSCVLLIKAKGASMLLTGDVEAQGEDMLVAQQPRADVLTIAHHGSRTSSTESFVQATRPQFAIASAGYRNRWGFPKEDVVARWQSVGAQVLTTAHTGRIEVRMHATGVSELQQYRQQAKRYWRYRPPKH